MALIDLELKVPLNLHGIKLKEYQKYAKVLKDNKDADGTDFINMKALEAFCGIDISKIHMLPLSTFDSVLNKLTECFKEPTPLITKFTMIGTDGIEIKFGFVPNLDKISLGEHYDIEDNIKDYSTMHNAMAVLFRPIIFEDKHGNYRIEEYKGADKYSEILKDMPISVVFGANVFFYRLGTKLSKYTMDYTLKQMQETASLQDKKHLEISGENINQYMHWLEGIYSNSILLPHYHSTNV